MRRLVVCGLVGLVHTLALEDLNSVRLYKSSLSWIITIVDHDSCVVDKSQCIYWLQANPDSPTNHVRFSEWPSTNVRRKSASRDDGYWKKCKLEY
mmetsp:Transcript_19478/g.32534  ORF Transcript_19478/g.32534 Transcript_19478/m.32534 type:complete len:95 (+) Transcript_19478:142-426(+)